MKLDVVVPTYNRQEMLKRTLQSLYAAPVPAGLEVCVTVVDNNSKDRTREAVEEWMDRFEDRLSYVFEQRQGRSWALNAGISATTGDLLGTIDDDEEIDAHWYETVFAAFQTGEVDFIGGPYVPRWGAEPPVWLPRECPGVIGWIDAGDKVLPYDEKFPGILMGGNAVFSRAILQKVGPYATSLGRNSKTLLSGEDQDMYQRLLNAGGRGLYLPELIIYHYVPPERLTKRYYRRWCFWNGVSHGIIERERPTTSVAYLCGMPRYLYGEAARGLLKTVRGWFGEDHNPSRTFNHELDVWNFLGFFYGKHLYRVSQ